MKYIYMFFFLFLHFSFMAYLNRRIKFGQNFHFKMRRDRWKKIFCAVCLWVSKRQELILDYISEIDEKQSPFYKVLGWK